MDPLFSPPFRFGRRLVLPAFGVLSLFAAVAAAASAGEPSEEPSGAIRPKETLRLFNGKNLDGWTTWLRETKHEDPKNVFRLTDGMLHITGDGFGYIRTNEDYRDYHLVAEFKWGERTWGSRKEKTKDSGILVHCVGPDGNYNDTWMASIEYQVIQGGVGDFILVRGKYADGADVPVRLTAEVAKDRDGETVWKRGADRQTLTRGRINWYGRDPDWRDELGFRGEQDVESPDGEWTLCEVVCDGGHVQSWVNGKLVNEGFDSFPTAGKILIQTEGAEIFFRKVELRPLPRKPPEEASDAQRP